MANNVKNILSFNCSTERLKKIKQAIGSEESSIDFLKIVPMPVEINIDQNSKMQDGLHEYTKFIEEMIYGLSATEAITAIFRISSEQEEAYLKKHSIKTDVWILGKQGWFNVQRYGCVSRLDWCRKNWGTERLANDVYEKDNMIVFITAWSAPHPIIRKIASMFPNIEITHKWADEDFGSNCGTIVYKHGIITEDIPEDLSIEAVALSSDILGIDSIEYDDYGIKLNEDGTKYVISYTEGE